MVAPERKCPACRRPFRPAAGDPWRPFCSERCQLIDLGGWLTERHAIPGEDAGDDPAPGDTDPNPEAPP
jgi:endogenous inhibitor of DNA gyrase (YacG/DUF329 family)